MLQALLCDYKAGAGPWAAEPELHFLHLPAALRATTHQLAASLGLFTRSDNLPQGRVLRLWRLRPAGWQPYAPPPRAHARHHCGGRIYYLDFNDFELHAVYDSDDFGYDYY